jgi:tetratricopeptide (TPR) repeat protein
MRMVLLACALTLAAGSAFPQAPKSREQALAALKSPETNSRADAIVWLANHGGMADTPLLQERLRDANEQVRAYAEQGLWAIWSRSGDAQIDRLMARGVELMNAGEYRSAIGMFSQVVKQKPDFAEGWNKRATVYFLAGDYQRSIADCDEVLKRNPAHFGALSGLGQIYFALEDYERSLAWFRKALGANPNLAGVEMNIKGLEALLEQKRGQAI